MVQQPLGQPPRPGQRRYRHGGRRDGARDRRRVRRCAHPASSSRSPAMPVPPCPVHGATTPRLAGFGVKDASRSSPRHLSVHQWRARDERCTQTSMAAAGARPERSKGGSRCPGRCRRRRASRSRQDRPRGRLMRGTLPAWWTHNGHGYRTRLCRGPAIAAGRPGGGRAASSWPENSAVVSVRTGDRRGGNCEPMTRGRAAPAAIGTGASRGRGGVERIVVALRRRSRGRAAAAAGRGICPGGVDRRSCSAST